MLTDTSNLLEWRALEQRRLKPHATLAWMLMELDPIAVERYLMINTVGQVDVLW